MEDLSYIAPPVDRELIKKELKQRHFLRRTHYGNKEIYVTTAHLSPNIMREIGRLRELSYASEGGGSGQPLDLDEYDTLPEPHCYKQLFVWSPDDEEIVGAYRFIHGTNVMRGDDGSLKICTAEHYQFSQEFVDDYLPYTVELGRAFVQPAYQPSNNLRKGMYSLDNLWDGLGTLALEIPETRYFFGKITMYTNMNTAARDLILYFYKKHFPDPDGLVWPYDEVKIESDYNTLVRTFNGRNYKEDYQILLHEVRALGCTVPPLINAYMNLTPSMRSFATCRDHALPGTTDTAILVKLADLYPEKRLRYMESYTEKNLKFDRRRLFHISQHRLPWWRKSEEQEVQDLMELKELKEKHGLKGTINGRASKLRNEIKGIKVPRRKQKKGKSDED